MRRKGPCSGWQVPSLHDALQKLVDKFTGIQGYDLAHGQFPGAAQIQFSTDEGGTGHGGMGHEGQYVGFKTQGRLLDAHDANSLNVLIPVDPITKGPGCCENYYTYNDDIITVQSLVTGQRLNLHVIGEYITADGLETPAFGKILADNSVVQKLSGGNPLYGYALYLNRSQRQTVFEHLHAQIPIAQFYDFTTGLTGPETQPSYSRFTNPYPRNIWESLDSITYLPPHLGQAALLWTLLAAIIIVGSEEIRRALISRRK